MPVLRVYRNLRRAVWSVLDPRTGRVREHRQELVLLDVRLRVSEAVRQRVIKQQRRTVHAYAEGTLSEESPRQGGIRLHYNPFESGHFMAGGQVVRNAARIDFRPEGAFLYA